MSRYTSFLSQPSFCIIACILVLSCTESMAQARLKSQEEPNGFSGVYVSNGKQLSIKFSQAGDYSLSRIETADKHTVAESVRNNKVITLTLADVNLTFYLDGRGSAELSKSDEEKLEIFRLSSESADVRKLIAELIVQRAATDASRLKGFVTIAMVLGDGPGAPEKSQAKANCNATKLVQVFASYRPKTEGLRNHKWASASSKIGSAANCMGCCGVGCWGCSGCWTGACWQHDNCVAQYGHWACTSYLDDAIASMYLQC